AAVIPDPIPEIRDPEPPEPPEPPVESFCDGGIWCGYTAIGGRTFDWTKDGEEGKEGRGDYLFYNRSKFGPVSGRLKLSISSDIDTHMKSVFYQTTNPAYTSPVDDDPNIIGDLDGNGGYDSVDYLYSDVYSSNTNEDLVMETLSYIGANERDMPMYDYAFIGTLGNYVKGSTYNESDDVTTTNSAEYNGAFIAGMVTEDSVINDINAQFATEGMTAYYDGRSYGAWVNGAHRYSDVHIEVTFGNDASWSGTWNGRNNDGLDGHVRLDSYDNGDYVSGPVGLRVTGGAFSGSDLIASGAQITANDGIINSGTVEASFYGPAGQNIGGVVDVVKTVPDHYEEHRYVDVFIVQEGEGVN
ncbi:MAG: hypothetical protein KAR30_00210, partial [Gammaproteobacteria bacterium]|nr:hypothetical protein [Gammaproteobacteria bacterium]